MNPSHFNTSVSDTEKPKLFPSTIIVDNHRSCNAACRMCPTQQNKLADGKMSDDVFNALLKQLSQHANKIQLLLFGVHGEPMLDKSIEDRVLALKCSGINNIHINTNGSALISDRTHKLILAGTDCITISIDGITAETYEAIRIGLKFNTVLNNIERCIRIRNELHSKMHIVIRTIIQTTNQHEIEEWKSFWKSRLNERMDAIEIIPIHNWAYRETPEINLTTSCSNIFNSIIISHDGSVPLCCLDHENQYNFGNIMNSSIYDIFNNATYNNARTLHVMGMRREMKLCKTCDRPETRSEDCTDLAYLIEREKSFSWNRQR